MGPKPKWRVGVGEWLRILDSAKYWTWPAKMGRLPLRGWPNIIMSRSKLSGATVVGRYTFTKKNLSYVEEAKFHAWSKRGMERCCLGLAMVH